MEAGNDREALLAMKIRPGTEVLTSQFGEEMVLLDLASECYFGLDSIGKAFWDALTTAPSAGDAVDTLLELYEVDEETVIRDLSNMIARLKEKGLVELSGATSA